MAQAVYLFRVYHSNLQCPMRLTQQEWSTRRQPAHCPESLLHNALVRNFLSLPCYSWPLLYFLFQINSVPSAAPAEARSGTAEARCRAASPQSGTGFSSSAAAPGRAGWLAAAVAPAPARWSFLLLGKAPGSCAHPPQRGLTSPSA